MNTMIRWIAFHVCTPLFRVLYACGICSGLMALPGLETLRWHIARLAAWLRYQSARRDVPAYRRFLRSQGAFDRQCIRDFARIPEIDKDNYVKAYSLEQRCTDGALPTHGVIIDESSGSTGKPTNWVRGAHERAANARTIRFGARMRLGSEPLFFINAFAMGPWATGVNLTLALSSWTRVKSLGPDVAKIANALQHFGPGHHYVIMGYPPFLKQLVDRAGIDWAQYRVSMIFGGEGMSEMTRRYLLMKGIRSVYGSYGASDLELNIAAETDFTIALRRLMDERPDVAARIVRRTGALPMIFQYNPVDFYIESNDTDELLVTICRPGYVTPKVRYNIHDVGHVMRFPELTRVLSQSGVDIRVLARRPLDLPVLFHYGRSDASVAYYGCKIPPADIEAALEGVPRLARVVDAFQLRTYDDADGDKRLVVSVEVAGGTLAPGADHWASRVFDVLATINQDFRESRQMVIEGKAPTIEFFDTGRGPFAGADVRIKRQYVAKNPAA
jgi:phenylacetate-CoA ligase